MAKQTSDQPDLVAVLQKATAEDKARVDQRIDELTRELETLRMVQRMLDVKLNGKPERKAPVKRGTNRAMAGEGKTQRERVYDYLEAQGVPVKPSTIAADTGIALASIYTVLSHEWFEKTSEGFRIARAA